MTKQYASIFNDVLGPIMRGPSSSHTAAAARIGITMRQMLKGDITDFIIEFDPNGSLATTYHSHYSDIGLEGGILNMAPDDERLLIAPQLAAKAGINVQYKIIDYPADHPNTYRMRLGNKEGQMIKATAISCGGGMIEFREIDDFRVNISGGFYESLIFISNNNIVDEEKYLADLKANLMGIFEQLADFGLNITKSQTKKGAFLACLSLENSPNQELLAKISQLDDFSHIINLSPCLPIASQLKPKVPFNGPQQMLAYAQKNQLKPWQAAMEYEMVRGNISREEAYGQMAKLVQVMANSVQNGLAGTDFENRLLPAQSLYFADETKAKRLIGDGLSNQIIKYISAIMESKSSMGVIVAAPTAGSCGGLPGTVLAAADYLGLEQAKIIEAMFVAGIIGVFIAEASTFAAEVAGCQAECGAGSGLAAAALVQLRQGSVDETLNAASMALQNILGMVCDPVAMGVEVPCLGKNIMSGLNALAAANMVLLGYDHVLPLAETIAAFDEVGRNIPAKFRCTGHGGLSITTTSKKLEHVLFG